MKKLLTALCACVLLAICAMPAQAAEGNVTYSGDAGEFIFAPGSAYSPTDLFPDFKDVMPGDSIVQPITVRNNASNNVKVRIYMRSLGAHPESRDFLSKLHLRVEKSDENTMPYMFDAAASETAQLSGWFCIGTLYSGGEVNLNVILDVPAELNNDYQYKIGYLDWEFMVEEYPVEPTDPQPPKTGDDFQIWFWLGLMIMSLCAIMILRFAWKNDKREEQ